MTTSIPIPSDAFTRRDPVRVDPPRGPNGHDHTVSGRDLAGAQNGQPFFLVPVWAAVERDCPTSVLSQVKRAAMLAVRSRTAVSNVGTKSSELGARDDLSVIGRQQLLLQVIDIERVVLDKMSREQTADAETALARVRSRQVPPPSDALQGMRDVEQRTVLMALSPTQRHAAAMAASQPGDAGDPELVRAIVTAPEIVRKAVLVADKDGQLAQALRDRVNPEAAVEVLWLTWALRLASDALAAVVPWLNRMAEANGGPVQRTTYGTAGNAQ
jgi:hypothetical protein